MLPSKEVNVNLPDAPHSLALAFASFTEAAGSLEKHYGNLQTEVAALRVQLERAHIELEQERENSRRSQALAEVATLLAHEIRNPLASLELFAGLLAADSSLGEDTRNTVVHVQAGLRTLAATVNNVLHFHSAPAIELVRTNLGNLVEMTLDFLKPMAEQAGVEMRFVDGLDDTCIGADPHRLQQVFLNLAMNAIRFMPAGGVFMVRGEKGSAGQVLLRVSDTGPGIATKHRDKVFEPGFTTRPGSPGLGLAVCKRIVAQHGGTIELADTREGAEFVLSFRAI